MDLNGKFDKIIDVATPLITFGVALQTATNVAVANSNPNGTFASKLVTFVSQVAGPSAAQPLNQALGTSAPTPPPQFKPLGAINTSTFAGIGILLTNYILKEFGIPGYNKYAGPIVHGIGTGTLAGAVIGGIFDPSGHVGRASGPSVGNTATRIPSMSQRSVALSAY